MAVLRVGAVVASLLGWWVYLHLAGGQDADAGAALFANLDDLLGVVLEAV